MSWILVFSQIAFAALGLWGFMKCLKKHKDIAGAPSVRAAKDQLLELSKYVVLSFVGLMGCVMLTERSLGLLVFAAFGSVAHFILAAILIKMRGKALSASAQTAANVANENMLLCIRELRHGRARGKGQGDSLAYFDQEDLDGLVGLRGHASLLNWATSRMFANGSIEPMWLFVSTDGDRFLLYPDDKVEVVAS